jgi:glycosyltransferase involved in cell wall biosynthesis
MLGYFFPPSKAAGTFRTLRFVRDLSQFGWRPRILTVQESAYPAGDLDPHLLHKVPNEVPVHRSAAPPLHRWFKQGLHRLRDALVGHQVDSGGDNHTVAATSAVSADAAVDAPTSHVSTRRRTSVSEWIYTLLRTPDVDAGWRWSATWRGLWLILRHRPEVLYATGGPWTTFLVARDLSRWTRVPLVIDFRDPWAHNPAVRPRGGLLESLARRQEASVVRCARRIVANTDVLKETLIRAYGAAVGSKCVIINNSFDEADYQTPEPPQADILTLSYVGSLYDAHSPEPFLRALKVMLETYPDKRGRFRVRLVGSGAPRTSQLVLGLGLDDVVEVGAPVPHAEAVKLQRSSQALLLFLTVDSDHSTFIPSKLFEYVAARRCIFAVTRGGALQRILQDRNLTAWIYAPEDIEAMADGLCELVRLHERGALPQFDDATVASFSGRAAAGALAAVLDAASGHASAAKPDRPDRASELEPAASEVR